MLSREELEQRKEMIENTFNQYSEEYQQTLERIRELEDSLNQLKGRYAENNELLALLDEKEKSEDGTDESESESSFKYLEEDRQFNLSSGDSSD